MTPEQLVAIKRLPPESIRGTFTTDPATGRLVQERGGITSEYYPTATGGKLDLFSRTVDGGYAAVPGGGEEANPRQIVYSQLDRLREIYEPRVRAAQAAGEPLDSLQAEYNAQKARITQTIDELDGIQKGIESGSIDRNLGNEAMWKMVAPGQAAAMFPTIKPTTPAAERTPLSPGVLKAHSKEMLKTAKTAPEQRGFEWGPPKRKFEDVLAQYDEWRYKSGYENFTPGQQRQLDKQWDDTMKANPYFNWDPTDPQVLGRRTYGQQLQRVAANKMGVSPFAQSVAAQSEGKQLDVATAHTILQEAGGDKNKARQIAKQRGYKL